LAGSDAAEKLWKELKQVHFSTSPEAGCLLCADFAPAIDQPAMHARSTGGKLRSTGKLLITRIENDRGIGADDEE
jgi:hypothetical protein